MWLPRSRLEPDAIGPILPKMVAAVPSRTALLVDDEESVGIITADMEDLGSDVSVAALGADALPLVEGGKPDFGQAAALRSAADA